MKNPQCPNTVRPWRITDLFRAGASRLQILCRHVPCAAEILWGKNGKRGRLGQYFRSSRTQMAGNGTISAYLGQDLVFRNTGAGHRYFGFESSAVPLKPMACTLPLGASISSSKKKNRSQSLVSHTHELKSKHVSAFNTLQISPYTT